MPVITDSTAIEGIFWRPQTQYLYVFMQDGTAILYEGVPQRIYEDFYKASSKGKYFNTYVRGHFNYRIL